MKYFLLSILSALTLIFTLESCNDKIELVGEFTETAVVYGLLDQSDSVHYIKITRAFIGPGDALQIAQNSDSSYFASVDATITEIGGAGREWNLVEELITNKDENGLFYGPEQKVYAFYSKSIDNSSSPTGGSLNENANYRLNATITDGNGEQFEITGITDLVSGISTQTDAATYSFKFAKNATEFRNPSINVTVGNARVVNTSLEIHIDEFEGASGPTSTSLRWGLGEKEVDVATTGFIASGQTFYEQIAEFCEVRQGLNPAIDKRNFTGITLRVVGGGEELYNYMLVNQPSSSIAQNKPSYTNITATKDHRVIGIFSSRFTYEVRHEFSTPLSQFIRCLDQQSTEVLCIGSITNSYNFCSQHAIDIAQGESYICN